MEAELTPGQDMEQKIVEFSDGEFVVRSYHCSVQKSAFSKTSDGYIQVTNKRVIYANSNKSGGTSNLLVSEVPLEDVGSINSFIGRSLNGLGLILFTILLTMIAMISGDILPEFMTHWLFGFFLMLPFIVVWLMEKKVLSQDLFDRILSNLELEKNKHRSIGSPNETLRRVFKVVFLIGLVLLVASFMNSYEVSKSLGTFKFAVPLLVFGYVYVAVIGFQDEFGLSVSARSSSGSGLTIRSNSFQAMIGKKGWAASGRIIPTADAFTVAKELGALVMDLQQAGDLTAGKWSESNPQTPSRTRMDR